MSDMAPIAGTPRSRITIHSAMSQSFPNQWFCVHLHARLLAHLAAVVISLLQLSPACRPRRTYRPLPARCAADAVDGCRLQLLFSTQTRLRLVRSSVNAVCCCRPPFTTSALQTPPPPPPCRAPKAQSLARVRRLSSSLHTSADKPGPDRIAPTRLVLELAE